MATFEDFHPDQSPTEMGFRMDMGRMADNIQSLLIPMYRAMAQAGQDPRPLMAADCNFLLGRLRRLNDFLTTARTDPTQEAARNADINAFLAKYGFTLQNVLDAITTRRNVLATYRDAPKTTIAQAKTAIDNLAAGFPVPKANPAIFNYLSLPCPVGWP